MAVITSGERVGVDIDFVVEGFEGSGELLVKDKLRRSVTGLGAGRTIRGGIPEDDVEDDVVVKGIAFVAVAEPVGGTEMDFDVAVELLAVEFDRGVAEVGAGFEVPPAGENDFEGAIVGGVELGKLDALVVPDALDEALADGDGDVVTVGITEDDGSENGWDGLA